MNGKRPSTDFLIRKNDPYYDVKKDEEVKNQYYQSISFTDANLIDSFHTLLKKHIQIS